MLRHPATAFSAVRFVIASRYMANQTFHPFFSPKLRMPITALPAMFLVTASV